jgi:hypothetical protein
MRSETATFVSVDNFSSADDLQLLSGMEALRAIATKLESLESTATSHAAI